MSKSLEERRAIFVYEAARLENTAAGRPFNPEPWEQRDAAFQRNLIAAVNKQAGPDKLTSEVALHDAWVEAYRQMGWRVGPVRDPIAKTHPDMVPFHEMPRLEQEKDWVFFMLCEIAARIQ